MAARDYSPLEIGELASSVMNALLRQELLPLPPTAEFLGTGLYAIYYQGAYPEYQPISELNRGDPGSCPIYIGKAVPPGSGKGLPGEGEAPKGPFLVSPAARTRRVDTAGNQLGPAGFLVPSPDDRPGLDTTGRAAPHPEVPPRVEHGSGWFRQSRSRLWPQGSAALPVG